MTHNMNFLKAGYTQIISEWKYKQVVVLPKIWTKKFEKFFPKYSGQNLFKCFVHILGNTTISYFQSEIIWRLAKLPKSQKFKTTSKNNSTHFYLSELDKKTQFAMTDPVKRPEMFELERFKLLQFWFNISSKSSVLTIFLERFTRCHKE